ncbi:MAG TPA: pilus assembly protein PilM [Planctomycetota bacterium]|nr:pilus assembly protein PilM [Planctomycetota bacterium]
MASGLGIDIGHESIKIVKVSVSGGKVAVTGALKIPRRASADADASDKPGPGPHTSLPADFGKQVKMSGIGTAGTVGVTGRDVNLKYLSVPPIPPEKLRKLLHMELAGKLSNVKGQLDDDIPEVTYDWRLLNLPGGLKSDLLVIAGIARNDYLMSVHAAMKSNGIGVETLTPSAFGLVQAYLRTHSPQPGETVVLCDVGHELLEIAIVEEHNVYFARSAAGGGKRFNLALDKVLQTGPDRAAIFKHERARIFPEGAELRNKQDENFQPALREGADAIAAAIRSSITFCRTQAKMPKLDFQRVYISGGGARVKGLCEYLEKKVGRPVAPLNIQANVNLGRLTADSARLFEGAISDMTVALGLAIIDADPNCFHFTLTPEPILAKRSFWRKTMVGVAAAVILIAALVPPYLFSQRKAAEAEASVKKFQDLNTAVKAEQKKYKDFEALKINEARRADYYARLTRAPRIYPELFLAVRAHIPNGVMLNYFGPKLGENTQTITGTGGWKYDAPVSEFEIRGSYDKAAFPEVPVPAINEAWLKMRAELLKVPGVKDASIKALDDPQTNQALEKVGKKSFNATITLQDTANPLKVVADSTDTTKPKDGKAEK